MPRATVLIAAIAMLAACKGDTDTGGPVDDEVVPPCAGETWGGITEVDDAVHVAIGGTGHGKSKGPMGDLTEALAKAVDQERPLAIHPGTWEDVALQAASATGLTIQGCSPEETILQGGSDATVLRMDSGLGIEIEQLTIKGGRGGVIAAQGAQIKLEDVVVDGSARVGVLAHGQDSTIVIEESVIRDTQPDADGYGWGAAVTSQGILRLTDESTIQGATQVGLFADHAQVVIIDESSIADTTASGGLGRAVHIQHTKELTVSDSTFTGSTDTALMLIKVQDVEYGEVSIDGVSGGNGGDGLVLTQGPVTGEEPEPAYRFYSEVHDSSMANCGRAAIVYESVESELLNMAEGVGDLPIYAQGIAEIEVLTDEVLTDTTEAPVALTQDDLPIEVLPPEPDEE